jgi:hypothetical protein
VIAVGIIVAAAADRPASHASAVPAVVVPRPQAACLTRVHLVMVLQVIRLVGLPSRPFKKRARTAAPHAPIELAPLRPCARCCSHRLYCHLLDGSTTARCASGAC